MGQRSQVYVRYAGEDGKSKLILAKYYQWNYSDRMISRARAGLEWIQDRMEYNWYFDKTNPDGKLLGIIFDVNFDMRDVVRTIDLLDNQMEKNDYLKYFSKDCSWSEYIFLRQDNNDGKLFIDIQKEKIKYCFTNYDASQIFDACQYMDWDDEGWSKDKHNETYQVCQQNIDYIMENFELMTKKELRNFIEEDI